MYLDLRVAACPSSFNVCNFFIHFGCRWHFSSIYFMPLILINNKNNLPYSCAIFFLLNRSCVKGLMSHTIIAINALSKSPLTIVYKSGGRNSRSIGCKAKRPMVKLQAAHVYTRTKRVEFNYSKQDTCQGWWLATFAKVSNQQCQPRCQGQQLTNKSKMEGRKQKQSLCVNTFLIGRLAHDHNHFPGWVNRPQTVRVGTPTSLSQNMLREVTSLIRNCLSLCPALPPDPRKYPSTNNSVVSPSLRAPLLVSEASITLP